MHLLLYALLVLSGPKKVLILGDSISDGYGVDPSQSYPSLLHELLKEKQVSVEIINGSISGSLSSSASGRLKWQLKSKPDIVILQLGGNDALKGTPPTVIKENLRAAIRLAKQNNVRVLLAGMKIFDNYGTRYSQEFENLFRKLAQEEDVHFIPFILEGVGGKREFNLSDGIHPNAKGHKMIADHVLKYLRPLL